MTRLIEGTNAKLDESLMTEVLRNPDDFISSIQSGNCRHMDCSSLLTILRSLYECQKLSPNLLSDIAAYRPQTSLAELAISAYKEVEKMHDLERSFPKKLESITRLQEESQLFKARKMLFPRGFLSLRSYNYTKKCMSSTLLYSPSITFRKTPDFSRGYTGVMFMICSESYLSGFYELIRKNLEVSFKDLILHVHVPMLANGSLSVDELISHPQVALTTSHVEESSASKGTFYHAYRYLLLPHILGVYRLPVFVIGADVVFARQPTYSVGSANRHKVGLYFQGSQRAPWKQVIGDLVYLPYTKGGLIFAKGVSNYIARGPWQQGSHLAFDQAALASVYNYCVNELDSSCFFHLETIQNDSFYCNGGGSLESRVARGSEWIDNNRP